MPQGPADRARAGGEDAMNTDSPVCPVSRRIARPSKASAVDRLPGDLSGGEQGSLFSDRMPGRMHVAKLERSPRLQRTLAFLLERTAYADGWASTREIARGADVCAVNDCAVELRRNGIGVDCEQVARGHWVYRVAPGLLAIARGKLEACRSACAEVNP